MGVDLCTGGRGDTNQLFSWPWYIHCNESLLVVTMSKYFSSPGYQVQENSHHHHDVQETVAYYMCLSTNTDIDILLEVLKLTAYSLEHIYQLKCEGWKIDGGDTETNREWWAIVYWLSGSITFIVFNIVKSSIRWQILFWSLAQAGISWLASWVYQPAIFG